MKHLLSLIFLLITLSFGLAQSNLIAIMSDTNGVIQRPNNFWSANSNSINSIVSSTNVFNAVDLVYKIRQSLLVAPTTQNTNAIISITNSYLYVTIGGTNSTGVAAVRLIGGVNNNGPSGVGTLFGFHSHKAWVQLDSVPRENGLIRFILGGNEGSNTNIAQYPTNRSVGFELRRLSGITNEIRLIAHNGTTNTNGPWTTLGTLFQKYTIGVEQNKTNGQIRLWVGAGSVNPTLNTNATISGGPTNNASTGESALEIGLFTTNTNAADINLGVFSALVEILD